MPPNCILTLFVYLNLSTWPIYLANDNYYTLADRKRARKLCEYVLTNACHFHSNSHSFSFILCPSSSTDMFLLLLSLLLLYQSRHSGLAIDSWLCRGFFTYDGLCGCLYSGSCLYLFEPAARSAHMQSCNLEARAI